MARTKDYRPGSPVHVEAGGDLEAAFDGVVTRNDPDNYLVFVRNSANGEIWGMPTCFVYPVVA
jgi:hypothetical protein